MHCGCQIAWGLCRCENSIEQLNARASYAGIADSEVLAGEIPRSKLRLAQAWVEIHREDLLADWKLAVEGRDVFKIDPLK